MMESTGVLAGEVGVRAACESLSVPRAIYYRHLRPKREPRGMCKPNHALSEVERKEVLDVMHNDSFVDMAPRQIYATLLDEGRYLCSVSTMYRILADAEEVKERRNQLRHPSYSKPELLATGANQVWSWDITKLKGPIKWVYYHLYIILDIFNRYVVGWMIAHKEAAILAKRLIKESCDKQDIIPDQLIIHSDRGKAMTSKTVAQLLGNLGVTKSHSRPYVSDDNPFSESQFKTLKYRPQFPDRFGCIEDARSFCIDFFKWYNTEHLHSGIGFMTPEMVHYGKAAQIWKYRKKVLSKAACAHPERFRKGEPSPPPLPNAVWINKPKETIEEVSQCYINLDKKVSHDA